MAGPEEGRRKAKPWLHNAYAFLVYIFIPVAVASFWVYLKFTKMKMPSSTMTASRNQSETFSRRSIFPVTKGVCIFISDAATGVGRETALLLADSGVHVLAGSNYPSLS